MLPDGTTTIPTIANANLGHHKILLTTFTDAGGLPWALSWASHVSKHRGRTPAIGLDGPPPSSLPPAHLVSQGRETRTLWYALPSASSSSSTLAASNGHVQALKMLLGAVKNHPDRTKILNCLANAKGSQFQQQFTPLMRATVLTNWTAARISGNDAAVARAFAALATPRRCCGC